MKNKTEYQGNKRAMKKLTFIFIAMIMALPANKLVAHSMDWLAGVNLTPMFTYENEHSIMNYGLNGNIYLAFLNCGLSYNTTFRDDYSFVSGLNYDVGIGLASLIQIKYSHNLARGYAGLKFQSEIWILNSEMKDADKWWQPRNDILITFNIEKKFYKVDAWAFGFGIAVPFNLFRDKSI